MILLIFQRITSLQNNHSFTVSHLLPYAFTAFPLAGFAMFVRPHHKEQFRQVCKDLTGAVGADEQKQQMQNEKGAATLERWLTKRANCPNQGEEECFSEA